MSQSQSQKNPRKMIPDAHMYCTEWAGGTRGWTSANFNYRTVPEFYETSRMPPAAGRSTIREPHWLYSKFYHTVT